MKQGLKRFGLGFAALLSLSVFSAEAIEIALKEGGIVPVPISRQELTRLWVRDDRIKQLFGLIPDLVLETDEENGQIFVKPLTGSAMYLTFVTEGGITQAVKLLPRTQEPEAVVFVQPLRGIKNATVPGDRLGFLVKAVVALRKAVHPMPLNRPPCSTDRKPRLKCLRYQLVYQRDEGRYRNSVYELHHRGDRPLILQASCLFEKGDRALALEDRILGPGKTTLLYSVRELP
jgi:TraK protein